MKTIFSAAIMAAANASNVHQFFAESNFACGVCQQAVTHANNQNHQELS